MDEKTCSGIQRVLGLLGTFLGWLKHVDGMLIR